MFASAIEGTKRKADPPSEEPNKRRLPDGPLGAPTGPRAMQAPHTPSGPGGPRSLQERLAPRGSPMNPQRGGMNVRGMGRGPMGQQPFRPHGNMGQQQQQQAFLPGQEEMMMQMMAMQANMMQMAAQMQQMQVSYLNGTASANNAGKHASTPCSSPSHHTCQGSSWHQAWRTCSIPDPAAWRRSRPHTRQAVVDCTVQVWCRLQQRTLHVLAPVASRG